MPLAKALMLGLLGLCKLLLGLLLRLRKLLKPYGADRMIATVRGAGYRISPNDT